METVENKATTITNRVCFEEEYHLKELLENLRNLKRGLEDRARCEVSSGGYELVTTICETLKVAGEWR